MKKRCCTVTIWFLSFLGGVSLLMVGSVTAATPESRIPEAKKDSMGITYKNKSPAIPPIDAAAPSNFETASFALG